MKEKLAAIEKRRNMDVKTKGARQDIQAEIRKIVTQKKPDSVCGQLLDSMTVYANEKVSVALKLRSFRWFYRMDGLEQFKGKLSAQQASALLLSVWIHSMAKGKRCTTWRRKTAEK